MNSDDVEGRQMRQELKNREKEIEAIRHELTELKRVAASDETESINNEQPWSRPVTPEPNLCVTYVTQSIISHTNTHLPDLMPQADWYDQGLYLAYVPNRARSSLLSVSSRHLLQVLPGWIMVRIPSARMMPMFLAATTRKFRKMASK